MSSIFNECCLSNLPYPFFPEQDHSGMQLSTTLSSLHFLIAVSVINKMKKSQIIVILIGK